MIYPDALLDLAQKSGFDELTDAEILMLRKARSGEEACCDTADPNRDPQARTIRADLIRWICVTSEAAELVDPYGIHLTGASIIGSLDLSYIAVAFPLGLMKSLVDKIDVSYADLTDLMLIATRTAAIVADGLTVKKNLFLRSVLTRGEVRLPGAKIGGDFDCSGGRFEMRVNQDSFALNAARIDVKGDVRLSDFSIGEAVYHFSAAGEVNLFGAKIGGNLDCNNATFEDPQTAIKSTEAEEIKTHALAADGIDVTGSVFLHGIHAEGEVRFVAAHLGRDLECDGAMFSNPKATALFADGIDVRGNVFLRKHLTARGTVRLRGGKIGGVFDCMQAIFENLGNLRVPALDAKWIDVGGNLSLSQSVIAGVVDLSGAKIAGDLECDDSQFVSDSSFRAVRAEVKGTFIWKNIGPFKTDDQRTNHAEPGGLSLELNAMEMKVASLEDDRQSWPASARMVLDGFKYGRIAGKSIDDEPIDVATRLVWLRRQKHSVNSFATQPYQQLAMVLRAEGDDRGARRILVSMEDDVRKHEHGLVSWPWRWVLEFWRLLLKGTVGYGYRPWQALVWAASLISLGYFIFGFGYADGFIRPSDKAAYNDFVVTGEPPIYYQNFNALTYSVETFVPILKLGLADKWAPNSAWNDCVPEPHNHSIGLAARVWNASTWLHGLWPFDAGASLRVYLWIHIALGWLLTTLGVAAVTGIIRR